MQENRTEKKAAAARGKSRMPENSLFFEKIVPILLVLMGVVMIALVLLAAGVLLGFIQF